jgi:hypothetical protein
MIRAISLNVTLAANASRQIQTDVIVQGKAALTLFGRHEPARGSSWVSGRAQVVEIKERGRWRLNSESSRTSDAELGDLGHPERAPCE